MSDKPIVIDMLADRVRWKPWRRHLMRHVLTGCELVVDPATGQPEVWPTDEYRVHSFELEVLAVWPFKPRTPPLPDYLGGSTE